MSETLEWPCANCAKLRHNPASKQVDCAYPSGLAAPGEKCGNWSEGQAHISVELEPENGALYFVRSWDGGAVHLESYDEGTWYAMASEVGDPQPDGRVISGPHSEAALHRAVLEQM